MKAEETDGDSRSRYASQTKRIPERTGVAQSGYLPDSEHRWVVLGGNRGETRTFTHRWVVLGGNRGETRTFTRCVLATGNHSVLPALSRRGDLFESHPHAGRRPL